MNYDAVVPAILSFPPAMLASTTRNLRDRNLCAVMRPRQHAEWRLCAPFLCTCGNGPTKGVEAAVRPFAGNSQRIALPEGDGTGWPTPSNTRSGLRMAATNDPRVGA